MAATIEGRKGARSEDGVRLLVKGPWTCGVDVTGACIGVGIGDAQGGAAIKKEAREQTAR